jgi:hypothetical protein
VGASGGGKSTVVRAGLFPALRRSVIPGSSDWFLVETFPGAHPFEELEAALLRVAVNPPSSLIEQLERDEHGLLRAVKRVLPAGESELLLLVDQFEELFTWPVTTISASGFWPAWRRRSPTHAAVCGCC